jgi:hypothetical protein
VLITLTSISEGLFKSGQQHGFGSELTLSAPEGGEPQRVWVYTGPFSSGRKHGQGLLTT